MKLKNASISAIRPPGSVRSRAHYTVRSVIRGRDAKLGFLTLLAFDADASPGNRVQPCGLYFLFAIHADPIGSLVEAVDGFFNGPQHLGIGLLHCQMDMKVALLAGLINPVAALGSGFRRWRTGRSGRQKFVALLFKN